MSICYARPMGPEKPSIQSIAAAVWWLGTGVALSLFCSMFVGLGRIDVSLRSPFDNTHSGHAEQWSFLSGASRYVPKGTSFTVLAPDRDTEMSLFMMAVGLLPHASPLPTSYYGQPMSIGNEARFVLELEGPSSDEPPQQHAIEVTGGWVWQRLSAEP